MALSLIGERVAIWIDSVEEVGKNYDHHTLARAGYLSRKKPLPDHGRTNATISLIIGAVGDLSPQLLAENPAKSANQETGDSSLKEDIRLFTSTTTIAASCTTTEEEVPIPPKGRKRKRKKHSVFEPNAKEVAAGARHEEVRPLILAAYEAFKKHYADIHLPRSGIQARLLDCNPSGLDKTAPCGSDAEPVSDGDELNFAALGQVWQADMFEIVEVASQNHHQLFNSLVRNDCDSEVVTACLGRKFLLPKRSTFLMSDFTRLGPLIPEARRDGYDIILLDPPWENKSVRRGATYSTLPNRYLLGLPVQKLAHSDGALVAIWVTNREKLRAFLEEELLDAWGLQLEATWLWLKVSPAGEMISPLDLAHHRPYEVLVLARAPPEKCDSMSAESASPTQPAAAPNHFVIISVPGEHSRKPPLKSLLQQYSAKGAASRGLEMFARELTAGWTSWGNEVLRFQDSKYFIPEQQGG